MFIHPYSVVPNRTNCRAPKSAAIFITVIVKIPLLQIFAMILGVTIIALEWPLPFLKNTVFYRSIPLRPVLLMAQALIAIFFYQVGDI